jgi:hypothetical protein
LKTYPTELKDSIVAKMLAPHNVGVPQLVRETDPVPRQDWKRLQCRDDIVTPAPPGRRKDRGHRPGSRDRTPHRQGCCGRTELRARDALRADAEKDKDRQDAQDDYARTTRMDPTGLETTRTGKRITGHAARDGSFYLTTMAPEKI